MFKFNEVNPGVAIRAEFDQDWSVQGGVYKNSYYKTTLYGVVQYTPLHVAGVRLGGFVGLGTGYTAHSAANVGPFSLLGGAVAIAQVGNASVAVRVVPKLSSGTTGVRTLELGYRF